MHMWMQDKTNKKHWRKNKYLRDNVAIISFGLLTTKVSAAAILYVRKKMDL
jgi:hypothetical protein